MCRIIIVDFSTAAQTMWYASLQRGFAWFCCFSLRVALLWVVQVDVETFSELQPQWLTVTPGTTPVLRTFCFWGEVTQRKFSFVSLGPQHGQTSLRPSFFWKKTVYSGARKAKDLVLNELEEVTSLLPRSSPQSKKLQGLKNHFKFWIKSFVMFCGELEYRRPVCTCWRSCRTGWWIQNKYGGERERERGHVFWAIWTPYCQYTGPEVLSICGGVDVDFSDLSTNFMTFFDFFLESIGAWAGDCKEGDQKFWGGASRVNGRTYLISDDSDIPVRCLQTTYSYPSCGNIPVFRAGCVSRSRSQSIAVVRPRSLGRASGWDAILRWTVRSSLTLIESGTANSLQWNPKPNLARLAWWILVEKNMKNPSVWSEVAEFPFLLSWTHLAILPRYHS